MSVTEQLRDKLREKLAKQDGHGQTDWILLCELADECGLNKSILSRFLLGRRKLSADSIDRLCEYLGLALAEKPKTDGETEAERDPFDVLFGDLGKGGRAKRRRRTAGPDS